MTNTSNGYGDPPDPPNANRPPDTLFTHFLTFHSAKLNSIQTEIDQDLPYNSSHRPPTPTARHTDHNHTDQDQDWSPVFNNHAPTRPDNTNNDTMTDIDAKMEFYKTNRTKSPYIDADMDLSEPDTDLAPAPATDSGTTSTSMPGLPNRHNRLQYTTNSKWDNSPYNQVSYRKKHTSHAIDADADFTDQSTDNRMPGKPIADSTTTNNNKGTITDTNTDPTTMVATAESTDDPTSDRQSGNTIAANTTTNKNK